MQVQIYVNRRLIYIPPKAIASFTISLPVELRNVSLDVAPPFAATVRVLSIDVDGKTHKVDAAPTTPIEVAKKASDTLVITVANDSEHTCIFQGRLTGDCGESDIDKAEAELTERLKLKTKVELTTKEVEQQFCLCGRFADEHTADELVEHRVEKKSPKTGKCLSVAITPIEWRPHDTTPRAVEMVTLKNDDEKSELHT